MKRSAKQLKKLVNTNSAFSATFIFRIKNSESEFERLNDLIDKAAESNSGFLGKESWSNKEENKKMVVYYWNSLESLKEFSSHPDHKEAKRNYNKWYTGFEVLISEVLKFKTDGKLETNTKTK